MSLKELHSLAFINVTCAFIFLQELLFTIALEYNLVILSCDKSKPIFIWIVVFWVDAI